MLWISKLIRDGVAGWISHRSGSLTRVWKLVALELAVAIATDILGRAGNLCDSLLADRFTNRTSVRLMEHATELDLASFEDPVFTTSSNVPAARPPAASDCWPPCSTCARIPSASFRSPPA